jgi:hypothetical protein
VDGRAALDPNPSFLRTKPLIPTPYTLGAAARGGSGRAAVRERGDAGGVAGQPGAAPFSTVTSGISTGLYAGGTHSYYRHVP